VLGADRLEALERVLDRGAVLELDNVAARDDLDAAGLDHRGGESQGKKRGQEKHFDIQQAEAAER